MAARPPVNEIEPLAAAGSRVSLDDEAVTFEPQHA